jgi:hypothetical protein
MTTEQFLLVENSIGQVERNGDRFAANFVREIGQIASIESTLVPSHIDIDPLQFLLSARDRFKQLEETGQVVAAPSLLPDAEQFNLAANAMLRALAQTLGPDSHPGIREAWISALRTLAEREPA